MRTSRAWMWVIIGGFLLVGTLWAGQNQMGVADVQRINFTATVRIGQSVLPAGDYEVRHVMEGDNHIMVFRQLGQRNPAQARVKCTLVPLPSKATQTEKLYTTNAAHEQVLESIVFRGDSAKHVF